MVRNENDDKIKLKEEHFCVIIFLKNETKKNAST